MKRFALIAIASVLIVPGLFAQRVKVDYNESHDFSTYRTYAWKGCKALKNDPVTMNPMTASRIREAVDKQLTLKEMREVSPNENPDVYFTCFMNTDDKTEVWGASSPSWGPGWGYGYRGYYGGFGWGGHSTVHTTHYKEATYVIDMVDAKADELVWRSHATMKLSNSNKDAKRIGKMANKAFKKFPAGPAATSKG